jgi:tRNA A37 methylthiotransferase MiaB
VVNERINRLRIIGEEQSFAFRSTFVGETVEVIIERDAGNASGEPHARHGRCERYFPVTLDEPGLQPGETVLAEISDVTQVHTKARIVNYKDGTWDAVPD